MNHTENHRVPTFYSLPRFWKKKTSLPSSNLSNLSRSFEENLNLRLKSLFPSGIYTKNSPTIITFSWLNLAVDLLTKTHTDAKALISELPDLGNWSEFYLDDSVKLLDFCNSITSEISRLQHSRLLIHFVIHLLDFPDGSAPAPENLRRARNSLNDWRKGSPLENRRSTNDPAIILRDLTLCLRKLPPCNSTPAGKLMFRTIYAVNAVTIFVTRTLLSALYGPVEESAGFRVTGDFLWADAFNNLESVVSGEFKERFAGGSKGSIGELDDVASRVARVTDLVDKVLCFAGKEEKEELEGGVKELEKSSEKFSDGLEGLLRGIHEFFDVVLCARNALLENFRLQKK